MIRPHDVAELMAGASLSMIDEVVPLINKLVCLCSALCALCAVLCGWALLQCGPRGLVLAVVVGYTAQTLY